MKKLILVVLLLFPLLSVAQIGTTINTIPANIAFPDTLNGVDSTMAYYFWGSIKGFWGVIMETDTVGVGFPDSVSVTAYPRVWSVGNTVETDRKPCETMWSDGVTLKLSGGSDVGTAISIWTPVAEAPRLLTSDEWSNVPVLGVVIKFKNFGAADTCAVTRLTPIVQ